MRPAGLFRLRRVVYPLRALHAAQRVPHYLVGDPKTGSLAHFTPDDQHGTEITSPCTCHLAGDFRVTVDPAAIRR